MRTRFFVPLWIALALLAIAIARAGHTHSITITTDDTTPLGSCDDIDIRFGDRRNPLEAARAESVLNFSRTEIPVLSAALPESGGISVRGWDQDGYEIKVCKAAGAREREAAEALLGRISVSVHGGKIVVDGPAEQDWVAYVLVRAPGSAPVDLEARNGGISLYDLTGRIRVRTQNGPVALHDCSGDIQVQAENGPIDFSGGGGRVALRAQNGPVSVALAERWDGEGLEVRTENGPLALKLPPKLSSGVRVEASNHSPMSCRGDACAQARKTWDNEHRLLEIGGSPAVVRISTVNGPVSVESKSFE